MSVLLKISMKEVITKQKCKCNENIMRKRGIFSYEYHRSKLEMAKDKGVNLFFVWEYDWQNRKEEVQQEIVGLLEGSIEESILLSRLESSRDLLEKL